MKVRRGKPHSVDKAIREIGSALARDFRERLPEGPNYAEVLLNGAVTELRALDWQAWEAEDPYTFKCRYQMADLVKKFRFEKDLLSSQELEDAAEMQFIDNQLRLVDLDLDALPAFCRHILFRARGFCHMILGNYDLEEHYSLCRNGKKASVGIPNREATEAARYVAPITGSSEHIAWFSAVPMAEDDQMRDYVFGEWWKRLGNEPDLPLFRSVTELALTFVPKTFKSLRSIMPNTTIGAFYSDGLGKVIRDRLKRAGYDIRTLQGEHRSLARLASETGELVTADQSLASDNITVDLVRAILPDAWFKAANLGRIEWVRLPSGLKIKTPTFCTMGIGFTFPLQTLIFLCLLLALDEEYTHGRSEVSVYGDDLIYSRDMHPFVLTVFNRLGLKINVDKTFASGPFRESCGSDFYAGVDVRPFQPKNERGSFVSGIEYEALLYTWLNGLLRRWDRLEVPLTFSWILGEIDRVSRGILRVPPDYPDNSGFKVESPYDTLNNAYRLTPLKHGKHGKVTFMYLRFISDTYEETKHAPYLWRHLGQGSGNDWNHSSWDDHELLRDSRLLRIIEAATGVCRDRPSAFSNEDRGKGKRRGSKCTKPRGRKSGPPSRAVLLPQPGGGGRTLRQSSSTVRWS